MIEKNGRVVLITGSTSGIGLSIAKQLASEGYTIAFHSKSSVEAGMELVTTYPGSSYTQADLSNHHAAKGLIDEVVRKHKRLDVLINNAAMSKVIDHKSLKEATPEVWQQLHAINVIAPWLLIAEAEPTLRQYSTPEQSSCIINISSHAGIRPKGASIPYACTKAALNHMTKLLALNLSPEIRVNAVAPGLVDTPMTKDWIDAQETWATRAPMKRAASPAEIAQLVSSLVSNNYLTGEIIMADGGLNLT